MLNHESAKKLHPPIVIKFERRKAHSRFINNIWRAGLAFFNVFLTKIYYVNKNVWIDKNLLYVIDIFRKYTRVIPLKDKKRYYNYQTSQKKKLDESNRKPNKIWVDKCSEFYNILLKSWLEDSDTEMYSRNTKKGFVAERFIRALNLQIYGFSIKKCI